MSLSVPAITEPQMQRNLILRGISKESRISIIEHGLLVALEVREVVYAPNAEINEVLFPIDSVLSIIARTREGSEIEIGTIGREGTSAFPIILGADNSANLCYAQIPGSAIKITTELFRTLSESDPQFKQALSRYSQAYVNVLGQLAACNRVHSIFERCSRWLLISHDRIGNDQIALTQSFLAMMLGTSRSGVTIASSTLEQAGFITYSYGKVTVQNRSGLEESACECYAIARKEFNRIAIAD